MKRKLLVVLVALLSLLMVGSVFMTALSQAIGGTGAIGWLSGDRHGYDALAEETPTFNTSTPTTVLDFSTDAVTSGFGHTNTIEWNLNAKEGYTTFTATGGDPHAYFNTAPAAKAVDCQYVVLIYRTTHSVRGEFFSTRPSTGGLGTDGTNLQWDWNPSGQWETDIVHCEAWAAANASETFTAFRFDPLEQNVDTEVTVANGDTLDIKCAAFFKTEDDAKKFNLDEYKKMLAYEEEKAKAEQEAIDKENASKWPAPEFKEMETVEQDMNIGTLKYTPSADGKTMTISYEVAGETKTYTVPNSQNYISGGYAAVDDLDRPMYNSDEVGSYKADERYVGLFYFLWHGEHGDSGAYDLQKIIDELGVEGANNTSCGKYGPEGAMHFFAEPLYGYYYASDAWVLRKHAELLTNANIDFLYFDVTNGYEYQSNALKLMEVLHQLNEEGYDAPQVVFYTHSSADQVVNRLYNNLYKANKYPDTWFCLDGKPVIIAPDTIKINGNIDINDVFTVKREQWPNDPNLNENAWPWMDFEWPQRIFTDKEGKPSAVSVSIAQHSGTVCFSHSSLYNNSTNRGRSFTNPDGAPSTDIRNYKRALTLAYRAWQEDPSLTMQGLNFQAQWDHAIASEAQFVLVTGWNEWVAQRQKADNGQVIFVDTSSMEFSRDAEMMRGGYFDNYYIQLIYNVQKLKGTAPIVVQDSRKPINVTGEFDQWNDVVVTYKDPSGDTMDRNATGFGRVKYTNTTGRNDIVAAKVTSDTKNVYFYVETAANITMFDTKTSWMQLYVNTDADAKTGWYGYDYIINNQAKDHFTTTVAKYNGTDGAFSFATAGDVSYRVSGKQMMITVPQSMLGIEDYKTIEIEFKWADSETLYNEMEDFYCDGDVAPIGRLNYVYQNYIEGQSVLPPDEGETTGSSDTDAEPVTDTEAAETTEAPGTDAPAAATGCASVLASASIVVLITLCGAAVVCRKKD